MPGRELPAKAWAALLAVYIVWGSTYLAIKYVVETMPPLLTAGVRFLIAGLIVYAVGIGRSPERPTRRHWRSAAIVGTALCLGGNGLVNLAETRRIASGTVALIIATVPLFLALFDRIAHGTRFRAPVVGGLVLGFGGVALLMRPAAGDAAVDLTGAVLAVIASALWAAGSLYARGAALPNSPAVSTGMEMIAGGLALLVGGVVRGELGRVEFESFSTSSLIALVYLILFGSLIGFSSYVWLLRNVPTTIAGTYAYVNPFVAVVLGYFFRDERLTLTTALAGLLIVVSVAIIVSVRSAARPKIDERAPDLASERVPT